VVGMFTPSIFIARFILLCALCGVFLLPTAVQAGEFPTGKFKGVGLKLERGNMIITDSDLHIYKLGVVIERRGENKIKMTTEATLQKDKNTQPRNEKRLDYFTIEWKSERTGRLINESREFKDDQTAFELDGKLLTFKTWVVRHQAWETHTYERVGP